jgi:adenylylsulfate kinase
MTAVPDSDVRAVGASRWHSLLKAFSWRVVATLTTAGIAYGVTGQVDTALLIGGVEFFLKIAIFYVHERLWLYVT